MQSEGNVALNLVTSRERLAITRDANIHQENMRKKLRIASWAKMGSRNMIGNVIRDEQSLEFPKKGQNDKIDHSVDTDLLQTEPKIQGLFKKPMTVASYRTRSLNQIKPSIKDAVKEVTIRTMKDYWKKHGRK